MNKKGFTLVELLAVIVILAVVILIAVTAVIPRMNRAKKNALLDEALIYLKAAKESQIIADENASSCINIADLNNEYVKKDNDSYSGAIIMNYVNDELIQTINLTDGKYYVVGTGNLSIDDVKDEIPQGFATSCGNYNPVIAESTNTNSLAYKLLMNEGGSTLDANLDIIDNRTSTVDFNELETDVADAGLYKGEDDDGATYYYRGPVSNNWVDFGGIYWRIIRINGDGSVRMMYSGLSNSSSHTGGSANIKTSQNVYTTAYSKSETFNVSNNDISGLTNTQITTSYFTGRFANNYVGYMYSMPKHFKVIPDKEVSSSYTVGSFMTFTNISDTKNDYYLFKNFDPSTQCKSDASSDSGYCTLTCRKLGEDCISVNWATHSTDTSNYSTTATGVYPASNPTNYIYTNQYKYTCWAYSNPVTKSNSDGTTSIYVTCPVVSEIKGTVKDKPTQAKIKVYGYYSETAEEANTNAIESTAKTEIELWYQNNIYNKKDSSNAHFLEEYITDEVFCNDRSSTRKFPFHNDNSYYYYNIYNRIFVTTRNPSFKCNSTSNDKFTLGGSSQSIVQSTKNGNGMLKYPVGLITADEVSAAGGRPGNANQSYYLYTGSTYWTMTPYVYPTSNLFAQMVVVNTSGNMAGYAGHSTYGLRPVINLSKDVLYSSGTGIESDPYKVSL